MDPHPALAGFERRAQLPGGELFYYDSGRDGSEPACVLVHGLGDEADTWHAVLPGLASQRRVIAPDLPGFGRSALRAGAITPNWHIQALLELLDSLKIEQAIWIGHSMGAMLAQQIALEQPGRAAGLVLLSGGLAAGKTRVNLALVLFLIPGVGELAYTALRRDPEAAFRTLAPYYYDLAGLPQAERDFLYQRVNQRVWSSRQRSAFLGSLRGLARWLPSQQSGLADRLANSRVATTIVWGEADQIAAPQNGGLLAELLPSGIHRGLEVIAGAGHNLQQEQPQAVLAALERLAGGA